MNTNSYCGFITHLEKFPHRWQTNIETFWLEMRSKIYDNMKQKRLSWRDMSNIQLLPLVDKYLKRRDWVSAANILFMIWENEERRKKVLEVQKP